MFSENSSFFGPVSGSPVQAIAFILSRPHGEYTDKDIIETIVPAYFEICGPVGIDPILAIAQMVHETGNLTSFWSSRPRRNPSGIGVNGKKQPDQPADTTNWVFNPQRGMWEFGLSFKSWKDDAVPAHVGRLAAYGLSHDRCDEAQQSLIVRAMSYRPLPDTLRGTAPTLKPLGKAHNPAGQGWASPGTDYGQRIAEIANKILTMPG